MVVFFVVKGENSDCNDMTILIVSKEEREKRVKKRGPNHLLNSFTGADILARAQIQTLKIPFKTKY